MPDETKNKDVSEESGAQLSDEQLQDASAGVKWQPITLKKGYINSGATTTTGAFKNVEGLDSETDVHD